jgi:hypothetical protein
MIKSPAIRESQAVKDAYEITLSSDMAKYLRDIDDGVKYANELAEQAAGVRVTNEATNAIAADLVINMANAQKALEALRKLFSTPLYDRKKLIDDAFKRWLGEVSKQETRLRHEMGALFLKKKQEAEEAERKRQKDQDDAAAKARATGRAIPKPVMAPIEEPAATTRTQAGTLNIRTKFVGELEDINLVPKQYLMLNERAVAAAINDGGVRIIPGIKIKEVPITSAR